MSAYKIIDHSYDVVVVGAGLTGLATATLLARSGVSVAVLEARVVLLTAELESVSRGLRSQRLIAHFGRRIEPLVAGHLTRYDDSFNPRA